MKRTERLMPTLTGEPVDRPPVSFDLRTGRPTFRPIEIGNDGPAGTAGVVGGKHYYAAARCTGYCHQIPGIGRLLLRGEMSCLKN